MKGGPRGLEVEGFEAYGPFLPLLCLEKEPNIQRHEPWSSAQHLPAVGPGQGSLYTPVSSVTLPRGAMRNKDHWEQWLIHGKALAWLGQGEHPTVSCGSTQGAWEQGCTLVLGEEPGIVGRALVEGWLTQSIWEAPLCCSVGHGLERWFPPHCLPAVGPYGPVSSSVQRGDHGGLTAAL